MTRELASTNREKQDLPTWLPDAAYNYLLHTENGISIRAIARRSGCHASTVLRQIRRFENRRDDVLIDEGLRRIGRTHFQGHDTSFYKDAPRMNSAIPSQTDDNIHLTKEVRRILRRLNETGAVMVVSKNYDKAVVLKNLPGGETTRTAVVDREIAQSMALKDWIACRKQGKVTQYEITAAGRAALKRILSQTTPHEMAEAPAVYGEQHRIWGTKAVATGCDEKKTRQIRYNLAESPLATLARRKDAKGEPFLSDDLVMAGERLREDFELAQMGTRVTQNWERFLTAGERGSFSPGGQGSNGSERAHDRVMAALADLGPGLGDVALRCCCYLEGMEAAEKRMGWSARSGKIVLRIALQRLKRHYEDVHGEFGPMIG